MQISYQRWCGSAFGTQRRDLAKSTFYIYIVYIHIYLYIDIAMYIYTFYFYICYDQFLRGVH
jgi:hypothetical protein